LTFAPPRPARAAASLRIAFIGVVMRVHDRARNGLAKENGDRRAARMGLDARAARNGGIDGVGRSSKGGAQLLGVIAGQGARKHNGD
jgi:hypothetical protein